MKAPTIDPNFRVGPYRLADLILGFRGGSVVHIEELRDYRLEDISLSIAILAEIGALQPASFFSGAWGPTLGYVKQGYESPNFSENKPSIWDRDYLQPRMKAQEARQLIDQVIARIEKLNAGARAPFIYHALYLFGSFLDLTSSPRDIDLAVETTDQDGYLVEESSYIIETTSEADQANLRLAKPFNGKVTVHDWRELKKLEVPYRKLWESTAGAVTGPIIRPKMSSLRQNELHARDQRYEDITHILQQIYEHSSGIHDPQCPVVSFSTTPKPNRERYKELIGDSHTLLISHWLCLPSGKAKEKADQVLAERAKWLTEKQSARSSREEEAKAKEIILGNREFAPTKPIP